MNRTTYIFTPNTLLMVVHNSNWCWWTTVIVLSEVYSYVRSPYRDLFVYDSVVQVCHFVSLWVFTNTNKLVWTSAQHISTTWADVWGVRADAQEVEEVVSPRGVDFRLACIWSARNFWNNRAWATPTIRWNQHRDPWHTINCHTVIVSLICIYWTFHLTVNSKGRLHHFHGHDATIFLAENTGEPSISQKRKEKEVRIFINSHCKPFWI